MYCCVAPPPEPCKHDRPRETEIDPQQRAQADRLARVGHGVDRRGTHAETVCGVFRAADEEHGGLVVGETTTGTGGEEGEEEERGGLERAEALGAVQQVVC